MVRIAASVAALIVVLASATTALAKPPLVTSSPVAALPVAAVTPNGTWTTYHHNDARTGNDPAAPAVGSVAPTPGWTQTALDGEVFAEPLIYNGIVYAATLNNTVYALNQSDGTLIWSKNVGAPQTGGWGCGNINPTGILGTPVIDAAANRIYVAAEITGTTPTYHLFGLDLGNLGSVVLDTTIAPAGFDWTIEQERGALALRGGWVYVPFGGRIGDCGSYHGYVVGVPTSGSTALNVYQTPSSGSGLWGAGGVAVDDATGSVFGATGNGVAGGCNAVNQNDAVVRLSPALALQDWFMPQDWQNNWCNNDQDLGSAGPLLISPNLLFQAGKWGGGFLLNPNSLGGVDGQLFPTPKPAAYSQADTCFGNNSDATFGSFAYAAPFVYVECEGRGLVALNVNTSTSTFSPCDAACAAPDWHSGGATTFGPPIVAGGAVWVASNGGGLYAFNATTGVQIFHSAGFGINRFVTPAEAGGQVFVPSHTVIKSFSFAAPPPPSPTVGSLVPNNGPIAGGTSVMITGTNFTGATAVKFGTAPAATFTFVSATQIAATSPPGSGTVDVTVTTAAGTSAVGAADRFLYTSPPPPPAAYTAQSPNRILDTRTSGQTLSGGGSLNLTVAGGITGVPAGATGVVLNVTVTNTTASSFLKVTPAGASPATVSNLNWVAGETRANLVNVPVGTSGQVTISNGVGSVDVVADEEGYFAAPSGTAGGYNALPPQRLLDTRNGTGGFSTPMTTGSVIDLPVLGHGGVPASGVSAVVLNATATNTSTQGFFTLYPSLTTKATVSNLNWAAGWTLPNRVIVGVGTNGKVSIYNGQGSADAVIDVSGYFTDSTLSGKFFTPLNPIRILDTRNAGGTLGPNGTFANFQVTGNNGVPAGATAVFLNTTVTNTTASSALTVFPGPTKPTASDLNWVANQTIPNATVATLSSSGASSFYNFVGSADLVLDISGYFS